MVIRYSPPRRQNVHLRFRLLLALAMLLLSLVVEIQLWTSNPLPAEAAAQYHTLRKFGVVIAHFLHPMSLV